MSNIRDEIKEFLKLDVGADDEELLKALADEIKKYHPNGSEGEELRKHKTEQFSKIHELYKRLKAELDKEKKNQTALVPFETKAIEIANEMDQIQSCYEIANLKEQLRIAQESRDFNAEMVQNLKKEVKQLQNEVGRLKEDKDKKQKDELLNKYQQGGKKKTWGFLSLAAGLVALIPICKTFMVSLLGKTISLIIIVVLFLISVLILAEWIFSKIRTMVVNDLVCKLMDGKYLEKNISFIEYKPYSNVYYYISKNSLRDLIERTFKSSWLHWLFPFDSNEVVEHVLRCVIAHYIEFGLFTDSKSQKLDTWFKINQSDDNTVSVVDDLPF